MLRVCLIALALSFHIPSTALAAPTTTALQEQDSGCNTPKKKKRSSVFGSIAGMVADNTIGRSIGGWVPVNLVAQTLTDAIACKLDQDEQKKAAAATDDAIERGVGGTSEWTSETRDGVSGTSTVTAATTESDGASCMNVNDVIIVNGEETTVSKRMCRAPGSSSYALA